MARRIYTMLYLISLVALSGQIGCTGIPQHQQPSLLASQLSLDESVRTQLGQIGVIALIDPLEVNLEVSPKGWTGGAIRGAQIGSFYGGSTVGWLACLPSGSFAVIVCPILFPAGYVVGAGIGALIAAPIGAIRAEPAATVEQAEASLKVTLASPLIPELLRDSVVQLAREQSSYSVVPMAVRVSATQNDGSGYTSLVKTGVSAILELKVTAAGLCGGSEWAFDPLLRVCMTVHSRLIRVDPTASTVLDERNITFDDRRADDRVRMEPPDGRKTFTHWAVNNGQLFYDELARTAKSLAEKIVEELFLLYPVPSTTL